MSVIQHPDQRVAVLIDTQNLYHSARHLYSARVNFANVLKSAVAGRKLVRAIAYLITTESQDEAQFFEALLKMGIETKSKDLQVFYGGNKKADWDVGMCIDAITLSKKVDAMILVTGDGDFCPLVDYLKHDGVQVEVVSFGRSSSVKLKEVSDAFLDLGEDYKKYVLLSSNNSNTQIKKKKSYKKDDSVVELKDGSRKFKFKTRTESSANDQDNV
jgi:uncharacterized LabA/DUF88 family protein